MDLDLQDFAIRGVALSEIYLITDLFSTYLY